MNLPSVFTPASERRNPDAISRRAYDIWNQEGCPDGCDLRHWLQAEQELSREKSGGSADTANDVSGNGNSKSDGSGLADGNGHAPASTPTDASSRPTSSFPEGGSPAGSSAGKSKRPSTADASAKTTARGSAPKRKSAGSGGRGSAL